MQALFCKFLHWACCGFLTLSAAFLACRRRPGRASSSPGARTSSSSTPTISVGTRWGWSSASRVEKARFPWLKTPNMDRLAAEGVRFRNAFVVNSLCSPSRASFLTGCYGHVNGVVNNHTPFPVESVTHARLLQGAGYRTGYVGKWHMGTQRGPRPGFDFSASYVGQGRYVDNPFEVDGREVDTRGWIDDVSAEHAARFIRESADRPFLLVVGFKSAHNPFDPPERVEDAYAGELARLVPNLYDPAIYMRTVVPRPRDPIDAGGLPTNLSYFRCLTAADESLGRILRVLDELRLADDTMVVFAGDNGYYMGEHRELGDKRSAYEESMRIPLLVRYPRLGPPGRTIDGLVLNVDLAPTLLDYAGVDVPGRMQGRSWRPLFEGRDDGVAEGVLLRLLLRARVPHPRDDGGADGDGEADPIPRPRRLGRAVRPRCRPIRDEEPDRRPRPCRAATGDGGGIRHAGRRDRVPHPRVRRRPGAGHVGDADERLGARIRLRSGHGG